MYIGRYGEFIRSSSNGKLTEAERSVVKIDRRGTYTDRVLDLLGVNLIFHPIADTYQGWAYPVWENPEKYEVVFQDQKFQVLKNKNAMDRTKLFYDYVVVKNKKDIISTFYSPEFDFREVVILEEAPSIKTSSIGKGTARISKYTPSIIEIQVNTTSPALLFLSDNYYPSWKAKILQHGKWSDTKIYRANYSFRAVTVPLGESIVKFSIDSFF